MTRKPTPTSLTRLKQDYMRIKRDPIPYFEAEPLPQNILEWHYVVRGPEDSPYFGGYYHGTLIFPLDFPFKPPAIYMFTPNGRFKTSTRLCLSMSDFHPDTWNPAWSVATILTGLLSFMLEKTPTLGSTESSLADKKQYAKNSLQFNLKNERFCELFPDIVTEIKQKIRQLEEEKLKAINCINLENNFNDNNILNDNNNNYNNNIVNSDGGTSWYTILSNLMVIIGFGAFALIVNQIIKSLNTD